MKTYSIKELEEIQITKGDLSELLPKNIRAFDYALPQHWLDDISKVYNHLYYHLILSTTFWVYSDEDPKYKWGGPMSLCTEVVEMIKEYEGGKM